MTAGQPLWEIYWEPGFEESLARMNITWEILIALADSVSISFSTLIRTNPRPRSPSVERPADICTRGTASPIFPRW